MQHRIFAGMIAVLAFVIPEGSGCMAAGAIALGLPSSVAKQGVSMGFSTKRPIDEAKTVALTECRNSGSSISKSLCKIVGTFNNQCVALAIDPKPDTPGFGWAIADSLQDAKDQALANCRDTAGRGRQDACIVGKDTFACDGPAN
jgi:hypothetical protein